MSVIFGADERAVEKRARLRRMRIVATGLLAVMAAILAVAVALKPRYPWLAWVEAFAEASVVGAVADWFAVVALFRHPLGLPIPHTAIVPRNKDRIGGELGRFVEQNFLTPENIVAKLAQIDLIGLAAHWLAQPANSRVVAATVREFIPRILTAIDDAEIERLLGKTVVERIEELDIAKASGSVLALLTAGNRHQAVLDYILTGVGSWLDRNREVIKDKFGEQSAFTPKFVDTYIVNRFVDGIIDLIGEVAVMPHHELRHSFDRFLHDFIRRLQHEPDYQAKAEALKHEILENLALDKFVGMVWVEIKRHMIADAMAEHSVIEGQLSHALVRLSAGVLLEPPLIARLNAEAYRLIEAGLLHFRHQFSVLIEDVVRRWDARDVAEKIELEVGRDLQFIRLNGTIVGGAVGLVLYALLLALG
jgi:uncharacterized membrane-anchored protein YjiN (DUF445 family)